MQFAHPDHTFELLPYGAVFAMADEPRLEQVVTNLLANAVEYGDSERPIVVRCFEEDGLAIISVRNEGEPIDEDRVHTIFEPLERDEPAESGSLGLGLFIVDQLVRAHEGQVEVQSGEDGTEFQVRLPLATGA
jgi:sigma-B regulation protein RsbU (phosphoserine phosphatase)